MFPPASGRDQEPAPPPEEPREIFHTVRRGSLTECGRILFFGLWAGTVLALFITFFQTWAYNVIRPADPFSVSQATFFWSWLATLTGSVHWFMLIAVIAAATEAVIRHGHQAARRTARVLRTASRAPHSASPRSEDPDRRAADIVEPLVRDLNREEA